MCIPGNAKTKQTMLGVDVEEKEYYNLIEDNICQIQKVNIMSTTARLLRKSSIVRLEHS
jgi:hypothetical protein